MDYKIGDFTGVQESKPDGNITKEDVQLFLNGMKTGLFLDKHQTEFHISNTFQKSPYMGPSFREILKLDCKVEEGGGTFGDDESEELDDLVGPSNTDDVEIEISEIVDDTLVHFGEKGSAIDTYLETIVASVPNAKIKNFFHKSGDATTPVEKNIGYVKIYSFADKLDYSEYDIVLPPVFTNRDEESVPHDLEFGKESVAIYGDYLAVSAFYSRPKADELVEQNPSAKIFIYKKYEGDETNDPGYKFYTVIEDFEFGVEPVLEIHEDLLFASDYRFNFIKVYSLEKLSTLTNYETAIPLSKIVPVDLITPLNGEDFNSEWGRSLVCRDGLNLFVGAPNAIVSYGAPISTGVVQHYALNQSDTLSEPDGTQPNPWKFIQTISLPQSTIPYWASDEKQWYDFHNAYKDGNSDYKDESPKTAGCGWGINDDLGTYFEEEELPSSTVAYYLVADTRMGEAIDFRNQKDSQNQIDKGRTYLTIGCPNYFDETDPNAEPTAKDGCTVIFDVSLTYTDITSIQGGEHQLINRIMPNTTPAVKAMEVGSSPGVHFDCDDVSVHIQSELPSQENLINRGSPLFWDDHDNSLTYSEATHGDNGGLLLHSAPYAKSYIKVGKGGDEDGATLGDISLQEQPSYLLNDDDLTIEFWYRSQNSNGDTEQFIVGTNDGSESPDSSANAWKLTFNTDTNKFTFLYKNSSYQFNKQSNNEFNNTSWNHIAIVHENNPKSSSEGITENTRTLNLYVNGVQQLSDNTIEYAQTIVNSDAGTYLSFAGLKNSSNTFVAGQSCYIDDIRITHGIRYTEAFDRPVSCFAICYFPKGFGASVSMDANYDVYALDNHTGGFISKYERLVSSENSSVSWSFREKVSLSKDEPVVGGMTSIYSLDLVYGNKNDLRIYPRTSTIGIHEGENENSPKDINLSYTISDITSPYDYSVMLKGKGIIDWGDGTQESFDFRDGYRKLAHRYESSADNYIIKIYGVTGWGESEGADSGQSKVTHVNKISENVTELDGAFKGATNFNQDISGWNTTHITSMKNLFSGATSFNQDLSNWNVENVTDMSGMFNGASVFNSDLSEWCVSSLNEQSNFSTDSSLNSENIPSWGTCNNYIDFYFNTTSLTAPLVIPFTTSFTESDSTGYDLTVTWGEDEPQVFTVENIEESLNNFANNTTAETISALYPTKTDNIPSDSNYKVRLALPDAPCKLENIEDVVGETGPEFPSTLFTSPNKIKVKRGDSLIQFNCGNYKSLQEIDLSNAILSNIEYLNFSQCTNLSSIIWPSELDCTNIDSFRTLFYGCNALTEISLENFKNTENVYDATAMFENCTNLTSVDLADFTGENLLYSTSMFRGTNLSNIDGQKFNTRKIINADSMFAEMPNFRVFIFGDDWNFDNLESANYMFGFQNRPNSLPTRFIGSMVDAMGSLPKIKSLNGFFKNQIDIQYLGWKDNEPPTFENVTDMTEMYYGVNAVERDILSHTFSKANTINLTKINGMLGCDDVVGGHWYTITGGDNDTKVITDVLEIVGNALNTDKVTHAVGFLQNQKWLGTFDVPMNLTSVLDMSHFFENTQVTNPKFSHDWDASELTTANYMFKGISGLRYIFNWNTSKLVSANGMFEGVAFGHAPNEFSGIDVFNVKNLKYADYMFKDSNFDENLYMWCTNSIESKTGFNENSELAEDKLPNWDSSDCPDDIIFLEHGILTNANDEDNTLRLPVSIGDGGIQIDWGLGDGWETYNKTSDSELLVKNIKSNSGIIKIKGDLKQISFSTTDVYKLLPLENYDFLEDGHGVAKYSDYGVSGTSINYRWYEDYPNQMTEHLNYGLVSNIFGYNGSGSISNPTLKRIVIRGMSSITSANNMFAKTVRTHIDINNWDASNVKSSSKMFCFSEKIVNYSLFEIPAIKEIIKNTIDARMMFARANDRSGGGGLNEEIPSEIELNFQNAKTIIYLFKGIKFVGVSRYMQEDLPSLKLIIPECRTAYNSFSSLNTRFDHFEIENSYKLFDINYMFAYSMIKTIKFKETDSILTAENAFFSAMDYYSQIKSINAELIINGTFNGLRSAYMMFSSCGFYKLFAPEFTAKSLVNAHSMFKNGGCTEINFPKMESKLENADYMFNYGYTSGDKCKAIIFPKISIIGYPHRGINTVSNLFSGRHNLEKIKLKNNFLEPRTEFSFFYVLNLFANCKKFNDSSIKNWDVSRVVNFSSWFQNAESFNQNLGSWDVSNGLVFSHMFNGAKSFVGYGLGLWKLFGGDDFSIRKRINVSQRTINFRYMFANTTSFNANINNWGKRIFNGLQNSVGISTSYSSVKQYNNVMPINQLIMVNMFENAKSFNKSLASWSLPIKFVKRDTGGTVSGISKMFKGCSNLNQDFSSWEMSQYGNISKESIDEIFEDSGIPEHKKIKPKSEIEFYSELDITISGVSKINFGVRCAEDSFTIDWDNGEGEQTISTVPDTGSLSDSSINFVAVDYGSVISEPKVVKIKGPITCVDGIINKSSIVNKNYAWLSDTTYENYDDNEDLKNAVTKIVNRGDALNLTGFFHSNNNYTYQLDSITEIDYTDADFTNFSFNYWGNQEHRYANKTTLKKPLTGSDYNHGPFTYMSAGSDNRGEVLVKVPDNFDLDELLKNEIISGKLFSGSCIANIDELIGTSTFKNISNKDSMFHGTRKLPSAELFKQLDFSCTISAEYCFSSIDSDGVSRGGNETIDMSEYDVSNVVKFNGMFNGVINNNITGLENWNVSNGIEFLRMFYYAHDFNKNISSWNMANATTIDGMFERADSFNQNLSNWNLSRCDTAASAFDGTQISNFKLGENKIQNMSRVTQAFENESDFSSATYIECKQNNLDLNTCNISPFVTHIKLDTGGEYPFDLSTLRVGNLSLFTIASGTTISEEKKPKLVQLSTRGIISLSSKAPVATILLEFVDDITEFEFEVTHGANLKIYWNPNDEPEIIDSANTNIVYSKSQESNFSNVVIQGNITHISFRPKDDAQNGIKYALVHDVTNNIKSFDRMFYHCEQLVTADMSGCATYSAFSSGQTNIQSLQFHSDTQRTAEEMFVKCDSLRNVYFYEPQNLIHFAQNPIYHINNTGLHHTFGWLMEATNIFYNCPVLEKVSFKGCRLETCKSLYNTFGYCSSLTEIKFPDKTTININPENRYAPNAYVEFRKITNSVHLSDTFRKCEKLSSVDLSFLRVFFAKSMSGIFEDCQTLTEINISNVVLLDTEHSWSKYLYRMFNGCINLEKIIGLNYLNTSHIKYFTGLFGNCSKLTDLSDINGWNTKSLTRVDSMLRNTSSLQKINLRNWCVENITEPEEFFVKESGIETSISRHPRWGSCPTENLDLDSTVYLQILPPTPTPSASASYSHSASPSEPFPSPTPSVSASYSQSASASIVTQETSWPDADAEGFAEEDFIVPASTSGSGRAEWTIGWIVADDNIGWLNEVFPDGDVHENFRKIKNPTTYGSKSDYDAFVIYIPSIGAWKEYHYLAETAGDFIKGWYETTISSPSTHHLDVGKNYKNDGKDESLYSDTQNMSGYFLSDGQIRYHFIGGKHLLGDDATATFIADFSPTDQDVKFTEFNGKNFSHARFCTSQGPIYTQSYFTIYRGKHSSEEYAGGPIDLREIDFKSNTNLYLTKAFADPCN